jgi:hypothetical protein
MTSRLFGGDLEAAVSILRTLANRLQYLLQTQADSFYNKESYVQQVFQVPTRRKTFSLFRHR